MKIRQTKRRNEWIPYSFTGNKVIKGVTVIEATAGDEEGHIRYVFNEREHIGEIESIVVTGGAKRGIGGELVKYAEDHMKVYRVKKVVVASDFEQLGGAEGFWMKMGYTFQKGVPKNFKFMEKMLV